MSRWLMLIGLLVFILGLVLHFAPGVLGWFGRLPGDIRYESENTRVYIPIVSMILVSIVLTVIINLFFRR
jgi:uncharacterized membrane protein